MTSARTRVIISKTCNYCSKFRPPNEIITISGGVSMCHQCYQWHLRALEMLANATPPPGCQECGIAFKDVQEMDARGNTLMYVHPKDGIYQVLCKPCSDNYERKRADLYGSTIYGHHKKIDGSK